MKKIFTIFLVTLFPFLTACVSRSEGNGIIINIPKFKPSEKSKHLTSKCTNGKQVTKIYIANAGFETDVVGAPSYWKYGIDKGWGIESDPTYILDPQKGAGVFDIKQHQVITFI